MSAVLLLNLVATVALTGVIWMVQLVHYPLFAAVGRDAFHDYHAAHMRRMTWVVAPLMLAELGGAVLLVLYRPEHASAALIWTAAALVAVNWLSTAFVQVPLHDRLSAGYDAVVQKRLVNTNWLRTAAWTARASLLIYLAVAA